MTSDQLVNSGVMQAVPAESQPYPSCRYLTDPVVDDEVSMLIKQYQAEGCSPESTIEQMMRLFGEMGLHALDVDGNRDKAAQCLALLDELKTADALKFVKAKMGAL